MSKYFKTSLGRCCTPVRRSDEIPVQNGLSMTPAQMLEMASDGVPLSSVNAERFYDDGQRTPPSVPVLDRQRGIDIGDLWENQMDTRKKMRVLSKMKGDSHEQGSNE